jgi:hypothetical protein
VLERLASQTEDALAVLLGKAPRGFQSTVATHAGFVRDSRGRAREGLQSTHMAGDRRAGFGLF